MIFTYSKVDFQLFATELSQMGFSSRWVSPNSAVLFGPIIFGLAFGLFFFHHPESSLSGSEPTLFRCSEASKFGRCGSDLQGRGWWGGEASRQQVARAAQGGRNGGTWDVAMSSFRFRFAKWRMIMLIMSNEIYWNLIDIDDYWWVNGFKNLQEMLLRTGNPVNHRALLLAPKSWPQVFDAQLLGAERARIYMDSPDESLPKRGYR